MGFRRVGMLVAVAVACAAAGGGGVAGYMYIVPEFAKFLEFTEKTRK